MPAQCPWTCAAPKLLSPWAASLDLDMPSGPLAHQGREKPERHGSCTLQGHSMGGRAWAGGVWQGSMTPHHAA
jgi:hypothetical protein